MTWALVLTSGAGMSRYGPSTIEMRWVKRRVRRSSSSFESFFGSTVTPPFAPPNGMSMSAVFHVMMAASPSTSSWSASGW
ncbi:MAG: hypothetical protein AUH07_09225 [Gemmatimonadetes bacterium 13_2_20CM_70_9]|nr:MAG: hypothetical protein AUH07_09225 [Gemmatimonadetes bacterium 13_2_20CM_70_9]